MLQTFILQSPQAYCKKLTTATHLPKSLMTLNILYKTRHVNKLMFTTSLFYKPVAILLIHGLDSSQLSPTVSYRTQTPPLYSEEHYAAQSYLQVQENKVHGHLFFLARSHRHQLDI